MIRTMLQSLGSLFNPLLHRAGLISPYPAEDDIRPAVLINEVTDILRYLSIEDRRLIYEMAKYHYRHAYEKHKHNTDVNTPGHKPNPAMS